jgi:hypothetical protein
MRLGSLSGRPLVHGAWGWIAGWIYDVWLDLASARVAALEICEADRMQFRDVEPFTLQQSTRFGLGIDANPDTWRTIQRDVNWSSLRAIEDFAVITPDGDRSCIVTDADCDPETWQLTGFRIRRQWWDFFAPRTLRTSQLLTGGANLLVAADNHTTRRNDTTYWKRQARGSLTFE